MAVRDNEKKYAGGGVGGGDGVEGGSFILQGFFVIFIHHI